jgi:hypothetical protein
VVEVGGSASVPSPCVCATCDAIHNDTKQLNGALIFVLPLVRTWKIDL